ncbi:hypothetical protein DPMN_115019 [Dreissena polymorpha]|uniref:Uncharacterized protein n=1 Tax=Dreissena polymorpha TaxID=45954 RepID=A0A9D4KKI8_DREPO|nr:hypothetical protein DPMN_115019 [Dreissena polymorpha]
MYRSYIGKLKVSGLPLDRSGVDVTSLRRVALMKTSVSVSGAPFLWRYATSSWLGKIVLTTWNTTSSFIFIPRMFASLMTSHVFRKRTQLQCRTLQASTVTIWSWQPYSLRS